MTIRRRTLMGGMAALGLGLTACQDSESDEPGTQDLIEHPSDTLNKTGMPVTTEPLTVRFMTKRAPINAEDYNEVLVWKEMEKLSGIKIDWGLVPSDVVGEKRNLALASGDYAEVLYRTSVPTLDLIKYGNQGTFIKVNSLIDQYMPNLKKLLDENPDILKGMTFPDGSIYSFPQVHGPEFTSIHSSVKMFIRKDWLGKLDLRMPRTTEDFHHYLKAVKSENPSGNKKGSDIPYGDKYELGALTSALFGSFGIGNRGNSAPYLDVDPDTKELRFFRTSDRYRELLEFEHQLYAEGLIQKEIYSIDDGKFNTAAAEGAYGSLATQSPEVIYGGMGKEFTGMPPLAGPHGDDSWNFHGSPLVSIGNFVITDKCQHPIEIARWMDYFYGDEGIKLFFLGQEGVTYEDTKDGPEFLKKFAENPDGLTLDEALKPYVPYPGGGYPGISKKDYFAGSETSPQAMEALELIEDDIKNGEVWPVWTYSEEESQELDSLASDIQKFVTESSAKFVTGKTPFSKWGDYLKTIEGMGFSDYMRIQQSAFERYQA